MAAVVTHMLVGLLVGLVAGVPLRYAPWLLVAAEWIDIDHIFTGISGGGPWWMFSRGTFHNVFVVSMLPALFAVLAYQRGWFDEDKRRFIAALPAVMSSHVLFDMINVHTGHPFNGAAIRYPFSFDLYAFDISVLASIVPSGAGSLSIALAAGVGLGVVALVLTTGSGPGPVGRRRTVRLVEESSGAASGEIEVSRWSRARHGSWWVRLAVYLLVFGVIAPLVAWFWAVPRVVL